MIKIKKKYVFYRILAGSISIAAIAYIPYVIKSLIDLGIGKEGIEYIKLICTYLLVVSIGMGFEYLSQMSVRKFRLDFAISVKQIIFDKIISYNTDKFNEKNIGDYISIISNDIAELEEYYENIIAIIQNSIQVMIYGFFLFSLNPIIALVIIVSSMLSLLLPKVTGKKLSIKNKEQLDYAGKYISKFSDLLSGFSLINKRTSKQISNVHLNALNRAEEMKYSFGKYKTFAIVFNGLVMYLLDISAYSVVAILLALNTITIGIAVASLSYIKEFVYPIRYIINNITIINSTHGIRKKVSEIIVDEKVPVGISEKFKSDITFNEVVIEYDNFVLGPVSCELQKGKKYAIVGESGSGKSTFLKTLIGKQNSCYQGKIAIDGVDIKTLETDSVIYYVDQFDHIYSDNITDNISVYGSYKYDEGILHTMMPKNFQNILMNTECTSTLSGGEKKIISIVRSIASDSEIMIMDEPFTGLDKNNTEEVLEILLKSEKTLLIIIHHASKELLQKFDYVLNFEEGRLTFDAV